MIDKQMVYGVDVSKVTLVVGQYESEALLEIGNAPEPIVAWLASVPAGSIVAMEATGVYHRLLAHLAHAAGMVVYVLNPQTLKHYARAIGQRGKTDGCDARMITRYVGHERSKLRRWQPPPIRSRGCWCAVTRWSKRARCFARASRACRASKGHAKPCWRASSA